VAEKTTLIQIEVPRDLNDCFNGHSKINGDKKEVSHEKAMRLYISKCESDIVERKNSEKGKNSRKR